MSVVSFLFIVYILYYSYILYYILFILNSFELHIEVSGAPLCIYGGQTAFGSLFSPVTMWAPGIHSGQTQQQVPSH